MLYLDKCRSIRAMFLYSCKVVVFGQKWLSSGKVVVFGQVSLYSGKAVVFRKK